MSREFGLLDTSVIIDLLYIPLEALPFQTLVSAITLAELAAGLAHEKGPGMGISRQQIVRALQTSASVVPFDEECAMRYEAISAAVVAFGRKPRGKRAIDYLIATTAAHLRIPLYTRNPKDFEGLDDIVEIVAV